MDNSSQDRSEQAASAGQTDTGRLIYVLAPQATHGGTGDEIDLLELWSILCQGKWFIAAITGALVVVVIAYALFATPWYRAEVVLSPVEDQSEPGIAGQLGGLAALAGVSLGGAAGNHEALAVLQSRELTRAFIEEQALMPIFFADQWDAAGHRWLSGGGQEPPDIRDAVKLFDELRIVDEDPTTGIVTLTMEWTDAQLAAEWANQLVARLNERMRMRALAEAEANVSYLQAALAATDVLTLQQSISGLLESELQKLMLAKGNKEFSFRIIDRAEVPKDRFKPRRTLMVALTAALGGLISTLVVLIRHAVDKRKYQSQFGAAGRDIRTASQAR